MKLTRPLGLGALALGLAAPFAGHAPRHAQLPLRGAWDIDAIAAAIDTGSDHVSALELAAWIRARKPGLRVIDVRAPAAFRAGAIPTAENIPIDQLVRTRFAPDETIVLYSQEGAHAGQAWVMLRALGVAHAVFVPGGYVDWQEDVMHPALATEQTASARAQIVALSRYFGGVPHIGHAAQASEQRPGSRRRGC